MPNYCHVYNRGIEKRVIFNDSEDYNTFTKYLKEYLSLPIDPTTAKRDFTINGRMFKGVPHQPKNYHTQLELVSYSLMPNHFHLLIREVSNGIVERFMRSLCTRYSMYFNKKYKRTGALFEGPYKSITLTLTHEAHLLTQYLHEHTSPHSSVKTYLGQEQNSWIKTLENFTHKQGLSKEDQSILERIVLESLPEALKIEELETDKVEGKSTSPVRIPELMIASCVFTLLTFAGLNNIWAATPALTPSPIAQVAGITAPIPLPSLAPSPSPQVSPEVALDIVTVMITDGSKSVNIRKEPSSKSEKVGDAIEGDVFPTLGNATGWYEIKLPEGGTGFISAKYIKK